ncbi:hypothetical protein BJ508DRAFT_1619 [Ascobolus immersus RN42]|uniref:Histidine kinase n=1 Tax=Ascobolus immersus RN42 TaxID=1160509 RepID=A0A3N4J2B1_ASCIM|nr:hypothetical protein BJ508DRAFT_1619 [Ascobolus immersus RN42]
MCHRAIRSIVPTLSGRKSVPELRKDHTPYRTCPHCGYRIRTSALETQGISPDNHVHGTPGTSGLPEGFMADLLLNNSPTPQMILSDENIVLFANRAAKKMLLFGGSPTSSDERIEEEVMDTSGLLPGEEPTRVPRSSTAGRKGLAELEGARLGDLPLQLADVSARRWISLEAVLSKVKSTLVENSTKQIEEADDAEGWRGLNDDYYSSFYEDVKGDSDSREGKQRGERSGSDNRLRRLKSRKKRAANERISTEYIGVTVSKPGDNNVTFNVNMFVSVVLPGGGGSVSISQRYVTLSFVPSALRLLGNDDWDKTSQSSFGGARQKDRTMDSIADRASGAPGMSKLGEVVVRKVQDMKDQILDDMSVCFISVTPTNDIVLTNRATRELLETDPDRKEVNIEWLKNIEFWREDFSSKIPFSDLVLNTILKEKAIVNQKLGFKTKDGKRRILNLKGRPLWRDEGKRDMLAALVIIMDQTEFFSKEKRMKTASKTKTSFLLNVGLGLRAPIAGIVGILEYLYRQTGENLTNEQKTLIRSVFKSVNSLLLVVNDIIDYTRLESGSLRCTNAPFNFTFVMDDVRKLFTTSLRKEDVGFGIDVSQVQVVPPSRKLALLAGEEEEEQDLDLILVGDGRQLRRVLINIIEAAFRYTSEGHVTVKMKTDWTSEDVVRVRFEISDTGVGLTPQIIEQIFQPFEKAVSSFEGISGENLGLAVSNALVNAMHGEITCKSIVGVGTTIVLNLPFSAPPHGTFVAGSLPGDCLSRTMGIVMRPEEFWVEDDEIAETDTNDDDRKSGHMSLGRKSSYYGPNTGTTFTTTPAIAFHRKSKHIEKVSQSGIVAEVGKSGAEDEPGNLAEDGEEDVTEEYAGEWTEDYTEIDDNDPTTMITSPPPEPETVIEEGRRVLLVEDNWAHSKIAEKRLKKLGCEVRLATNGHKALLMLRDKIQKPDLIFMDLEMPLLNGYETTHRIRTSPSYEHISNVPVIAVTSVEDPESQNRALNAGMDDFMLKPLAPDALSQMLHKWTPKQKKQERRRRKKNVKVMTERGDVRRPGQSSDGKKASEGRSAASARGSDGTRSVQETPTSSPLHNQRKLTMLHEMVEAVGSKVSRKTSDDSRGSKNLEAPKFDGRSPTKGTVRALTGILSGSRSPVPIKPLAPKNDALRPGELDLAKLNESLENEVLSRAKSREYSYLSEEVGLDLNLVDNDPESVEDVRAPAHRNDSLKPPLPHPIRADSLRPPPPPKRAAESAAAQTKVEPKGAFVFPSSVVGPAQETNENNGGLKTGHDLAGRKKPSRRQSTQYPTNLEKQQLLQQQNQLQTGEPQEQRASVSSAGGDPPSSTTAGQAAELSATEKKEKRRRKPRSSKTSNRLKGRRTETRQASPENSDSEDGRMTMAGTEAPSMIGSGATSPVGGRSQSEESLSITGGFPGVW